VQAEAFAVVRAALKKTKKAALGKIAFGGREHVFAVTAHEDDKLGGLMGYTMRYQEELRDPAEYFGEIKKVAVNADSLELAMELIKRKASKFEPEKFKDQYEAAVRELVEAKIKHLPVPKDDEVAAPRRGQVINLMDALKKSVGGGEVAEAPSTAKKKPAAAAAKTAAAKKEGISLVKSASKRKSA